MECTKSTSKLTYKIETDSQTQRTNLWLQGGKVERRDKVGFWDGHVHMLNLKQITKKDLLYSTGNTAQYSVIN